MNMFKMELKRGLKPLAIWSIVCVLLIILFMSMFPSMKDSGMQELVNTKMDAMPKALLEAFNLENMPDFSKLNEYFAYVFQYIVIAGSIYGGILGSKALIKEESEGTIEFLYAQPVSRTKIVTMKILSSVVIFYLFVMVMALASIGISLLVKPEDLKVIDLVMDMKLLFGGFFLIGLVFMSIGFLISVVIKSLRLAMPISTGIFFTTYLLGTFSGMIDSLEFLKYFSPFHYAVPSELLKNGLDISNVVISIVIIIVTITATYFIYRRKDFII
ncbi:ABC transporter permease subunit [Clostridium tunisiense]|uniref:ABC transporter permease subunit n=1 Tax=Clostridium tunisiense TaxID=219748 RepID=UPI00031F1C13|nr:ABC transporter permease subunit [Clostridium tunisiense]